ncbi:MAG: hypothetical protein R3199_08990 [Gemmatimonadota bacterium]|nr:hypothetical protein [Gemmatimonadota bacterium]
MSEFRLDRTRSAIAAALTIALIVGCGEGAQEETGEGGAATEEVATGEGATGSSCVAEYAETPCDLLTADLVQQHLPDAPAELEQNSYSGSSFSSCSYSWPSDRMATQTVMDRTIEYEESNQVSLAWIETYEENAADRFRRAYLPTEEELQRGAEMMEERFERRAEEEGLGETEKEVGKGLAESVMSGMSFERVDGVGDNASWNGGHDNLNVLHGDTRFEITATVSGDDAENRRAAVEVAKALMAACE